MARLLCSRFLPFWFTLFLAATAALAADQPTDRSLKIEQALKQRSEAAVLAGRIARLAAGGMYEEAERILAELVKTRPVDGDGQRLLAKVYYQLSTMEQLRALDRWCASRPTSHFPFTVRGMYFLERARFLDGANKTLLLSEQQRQDFNLFIRKGRADLEKAAGMDTTDPGPPAAMTAMALHLKLPREEMENWFQRAVDIDAGWLGAHRAKLIYLSPWWYGSDQMMADFAAHCFDPESAGPTAYIVSLDYLKLKSARLGKGVQGVRFLLAPENYRLMSRGLDRYMEDFPDSPGIAIYLELQERTISEPETTIAALTDTLDAAPRDIEARKGRVLAYLQAGRFREAESDLRYLEKRQGETAFSRFYLGVAAFEGRQDLAEAHQLIDAAVTSEPSAYKRKNYLYQRAEFYRQSGRLPEAIADYSAAVNEDVLFEEAYFGRAQAHYAQNDLEAALADLEIIKSPLKGKLTAKARALINSYLKKPIGIVDRASAPRLDNIQLGPGPTAPSDPPAASNNEVRQYLIRGLRHYYAGEIEAARHDFYRLISREPAAAKAYFMLGEIAAHHDFNQVEACLFYQEAHRLAPDTPDYLLELSRCLYRQRNFAAAITLLSGFINDSDPPPLDDTLRAQIFFLRALCLEESGLVHEALEDMEQALVYDPKLKAAALFIRDYTSEIEQAPLTSLRIAPLSTTSAPSPQLAEAARFLEAGRRQQLEGDISGAKVSFLRAIRLNPEDSRAYHHLGRLYFEHEQNYDKARIYYSQAIARDNRIAHYYFDRAAIHYFFKQYELAREDFTRALQLDPSDSRSLYYRGVCSHYLGDMEAARRDFEHLRQFDEVWNVEIERFRNAWQAEIDEFLENPL